MTQKSAAAKRHDAALVERYLNALAEGTKYHNAEWLENKIVEVKESMTEAATMVQKLKLLQRLKNYEEELVHADNGSAQNDFIKVCMTYSEEHGIEYDTWREMGVPPKVLKAAGW